MKFLKAKFTPIFSVLFLLLLVVSFLPLSQIDFTSNAQSQSIFNIDVYDRQGNVMTGTAPVNYADSQAYVYKWANASKFVFRINLEEEKPTPKYDKNNNPYFEGSISIEYLKSYKESNNFYQGATVYINNCFTANYDGEDGYKKFTNFINELNIDQGITVYNAGIPVTASEWGIYRFKFNINGRDIYSDYYVIEPTLDINNKPELSVKLSSSTTSLRNAYNFKLGNIDEYRYIDTSKLVWYAKGVSAEGALLALTTADLGTTGFEDCTGAIYDENGIKRTGLEFTFEDNGFYGDWQVWCKYQAEGSTKILQSDKYDIKTKPNFNQMNIIYVFLGFVALLIAVTIGVCIYKIKHEKIY